MNPHKIEQTTTTLGVPLFTTDLYMPCYRKGVAWFWEQERSGYFLDRVNSIDLYGMSEMVALMCPNHRLPSGWKT